MDLMHKDWRQFSLRHVTDEPEIRLSEEFVRSLLLKYGEVERAADATLIREMVHVAQSQSGLLDDEAWINALSSGLEDWDVQADGRFSTFFEDVFGMTSPRHVEAPEQRISVSLKSPETNDEEIALAGNSNNEATPGVTDFNAGEDALDVEDVASCTKSGTANDTTDKVEKSIGERKPRCWKSQQHLFNSERFNIDMVIDAHASLCAVVVIWLFFILS